MTSRPCSLCGGRAGGESFPYRTSWRGQTFHYLRCTGCGAVYVDPVPSEEQLRSTYDWDGYHAAEYGAVETARYERSAAELARHRPPPATVLDFGCGAGGFLRAAARAGYAVRGVEVTPEVAAAAAAGTGCRVDVLSDVLAERPTFDVIVLRDVLPHVVDPAATLEQLAGLLAPSGAFFFDGPLEEGPSIVRWVAGGLAAAKRRLGRVDAAGFAPTMLVRVSAATQRRFLIDRMGYRELHFARYETGWPYHVPGRRPTSISVAAKEAVAVVARTAARVAPLGNRFVGLYAP